MSKLSIIESVLYALGQDGIEVSEIKKVCNIDAKEIKSLLKKLQNKYKEDEDCGLVLKNFGKKYFILTKEENASELAKLINIRIKNPLTKSLLETLSIIAYNEPCTKLMVSQIRNADAAFAFDKLESLDLICKKGRASTPGSPFLYKTTDTFLNCFGLKNIRQLPKMINPTFEDTTTEDISFFDSSREEG